jgi:hypothetical protein
LTYIIVTCLVHHPTTVSTDRKDEEGKTSEKAENGFEIFPVFHNRNPVYKNICVGEEVLLVVPAFL